MIPWRAFSIYEEEKAAWMIKDGIYGFRVGNSSRNTIRVGWIQVEQSRLSNAHAINISVGHATSPIPAGPSL